MRDWISLVEAGYRLDGGVEAWLERVVSAALPLLDGGGGLAGHVFRASATSVQLEHLAVQGGAPELRDQVRRTNADASPAALAGVYQSGQTAATLSETVFATVPGEAERFEQTTGGKFRDTIGILAVTGSGQGLSLAAPLREIRSMTGAERKRWTCVAAHLGAGLRLRLALAAGDPAAQEEEAVLRPDGVVLDAHGAAEPAGAREALRSAVRRRESARSGKPDDADAALALWEALVRGQWSIVDRFDADGRRYVVARQNAPRLEDLRGLAPRERQVAEFAGRGRTTKEIAYLLGVTPAAVRNATLKAQAKLGLRSRAELASFFAPAGLRARLSAAEIAGEALAVGSYAGLDSALLDRLTHAERQIAASLLRGETNAEIGRARGSAERTIANQARAIYQKFGVSSRAELAAVLAAETP